VMGYLEDWSSVVCKFLNSSIFPIFSKFSVNSCAEILKIITLFVFHFFIFEI